MARKASEQKVTKGKIVAAYRTQKVHQFSRIVKHEIEKAIIEAGNDE